MRNKSNSIGGSRRSVEMYHSQALSNQLKGLICSPFMKCSCKKKTMFDIHTLDFSKSYIINLPKLKRQVQLT